MIAQIEAKIFMITAIQKNSIRKQQKCKQKCQQNFTLLWATIYKVAIKHEAIIFTRYAKFINYVVQIFEWTMLIY